MPSPLDALTLKRYSFVEGSSLKYWDSTGHDPGMAGDFLEGVAAQWAYENAWVSPRAQSALAAQPAESIDTTAGRVAGNVLSTTGNVGGGHKQ